MKLAPAPALPGDDAAVHPFVNAFANIGAMMGRDLGVVALRAIENQRGGMGAVLFWAVGRVPQAIVDKLPKDPAFHQRLVGVMLIPVGAQVPPFNFIDDEEGKRIQSAEVTIIDGSKLVAFLRDA